MSRTHVCHCGWVGEFWTVGHWTCPREVFLGVLDGAGIELVADVRARPATRRDPRHLAAEPHRWLTEAGIGYERIPELGGRRPRQDVEPGLNAGWRDRGLHNYADHTLSDDYERGIARLLELGGARRVAYLGDQPMPWRCHRLLISNTLVACGQTVSHLVAGRAPTVHELGKWGAHPVEHGAGQLVYPAEG